MKLVHKVRLRFSKIRVMVTMALLFFIITVRFLTQNLPEQLKPVQRRYSIENNSSNAGFMPSLKPNDAETGSEAVEKDTALASLSEIVQAQLAELQSNKSRCKGPTFLCGHNDQGCGLGCQIHHNAYCVALSYGMRMPLIHKDVGWRFKKKWGDAFQRFGSGCQPSAQTINVKWLPTGPLLTRIGVLSANYTNTTEQILFPLKNGLLVPRTIGLAVNKLHENPFLWWIGQFAKSILRLTKEEQHIVNEAKIRLGIGIHGHSTFGLHIRRTDKLVEATYSYREIKDYMNAADELAKTFFNTSDTRNMSVFVASDLHTVLQEARDKFTAIISFFTAASFPKRSILGFPSNTSLLNQDQRANALDDIVRDLVILSESEYVVCGFTSNVCRLCLELMSARRYDAGRRIKSVHQSHIFQIVGLVIPKKLIFTNYTN